MKRSRTCQCLQDLDVPKRSRSTPDLGALQRARDVFGRDGFALDNVTSNVRAAWGFLRPGVHMPSAIGGVGGLVGKALPSSRHASGQATGPATPSLHNSADSIIRSTGSLNDMVIFEHEQFILGDSSSSSSRSSTPEDSVSTPLFGGALASGLFHDSEDNSDYFCGLDSDDADGSEVNSSTVTLDTATTAPYTPQTSSIAAQDFDQSTDHGDDGHDHETADTGAIPIKWTSGPHASRAPTTTTTAAPPWCGQRDRFGQLSPGRQGGPGMGRGWMVAINSDVHPGRMTRSAGDGRATQSCGYDSGTSNEEDHVETVSPPWPLNSTAIVTTVPAPALTAKSRDRCHRHCDAGGGRPVRGGGEGGGSQDNVVAHLNVNLDKLHLDLESRKRVATRVV